MQISRPAVVLTGAAVVLAGAARTAVVLTGAPGAAVVLAGSAGAAVVLTGAAVVLPEIGRAHV